jgi:hypothetical protein
MAAVTATTGVSATAGVPTAAARASTASEGATAARSTDVSAAAVTATRTSVTRSCATAATIAGTRPTVRASIRRATHDRLVHIKLRTRVRSAASSVCARTVGTRTIAARFRPVTARLGPIGSRSHRVRPARFHGIRSRSARLRGTRRGAVPVTAAASALRRRARFTARRPAV